MNHFYEFGSLRLDATNRLLYRNGEELPLQPRLVETLIALVENSSAVVDKDSLMNAVWGDTAVEEGGLKRNISILRKALGDDGRFIETLPKRGYRFSAQVKESWEECSTNCAPTTEVVLERRANLRITSEEYTESDQRTSITQSAKLLWRSNRSAPISAAVIVLTLSTFVYLLASGRIGRATSSAKVTSIAVLPFRDLSTIVDDEHLGLGVADLLITRLANLRAVSVRPTSAVLRYDQQQQDSAEAGRALKVDAVLEGSIQHRGDHIRITVRLVRVADQSQIWAAQFDEQAKDLMSVQNRMSEQMADSLALHLSGKEKAALARRYTENMDAYRLYVKGRYHWNKRNPEGMTQAEHFFRQAIDKDPNFALAYLGLADTLLTRADPGESYKAIEKANELDPNLGEAYATSGFADMFHKWDWRTAEENFKRAIGLNSGYGTAHQWYATLLAITGRVDDAKLEMRRALEIDPMSPNFLADLGQMHYFAHEYAAAESYCRKALEDSPDFVFAHQYLFDIYLKMGRPDEALEEYSKWSITEGSDSRYSNTLAGYETALRELYRRVGINGLLRLRIEQTGTFRGHCYVRALYCARLGERERALDWLEKSCENREFLLPFIKADPVFDDLRSAPRFQGVLRRMGLAS